MAREDGAGGWRGGMAFHRFGTEQRAVAALVAGSLE
jgi:hypothetical protein